MRSAATVCKLFIYNTNITRELRQVCKLLTTISTRKARELDNSEGSVPSQKRNFEHLAPKGVTHRRVGFECLRALTVRNNLL